MSAVDIANQGLIRHPVGGYLFHPDGRRLGRKVRPVAERDPRAFKLSRYLRPKLLTTPPDAIDHTSLVPNYPMYGNDQYGDCGPAGAGHQTQSWSIYAGRPELKPTLQQVLEFYFYITGGQDTGVYLEDMFSAWQHRGLAGDKIEAYVEIEAGNTSQYELGNQLFGSVGIGLSLPDRNTFGPWDSPNPLRDYGPPNPNNGHYVTGMAYNRNTGLIKVATWGDVYIFTYAFLEAYNDQSMVGLNDLMLNPNTGQSPELFNFDTLQYDLAHVRDPLTPPPGPNPPPEPPPDNPPPAPVPGNGCNVALAWGYSALKYLDNLLNGK